MNDAVEHDCVGALLVRDGEVLLGRRAADREWLADAWDVFGGHIETGESPQQALLRELDEELGIVPERLHYLGTLSGSTPTSWRLQLYAVTAWRGEPGNRLPAEHAYLQWCRFDEAQRHLQSAHPDFPRMIAAAAALLNS